jgi:branched-subunit amino acid transport protein
MRIWLVIFGASVITLATRFSFIYLHGKASFPAWFRQSLHYVPAAVLAAIVLPGVAMRQDTLMLSLSNPRLWAGVIAGLIAWRTGNALLTMIAGMCSLWLLQLWL